MDTPRQSMEVNTGSSPPAKPQDNSVAAKAPDTKAPDTNPKQEESSSGKGNGSGSGGGSSGKPTPTTPTTPKTPTASDSKLEESSSGQGNATGSAGSSGGEPAHKSSPVSDYGTAADSERGASTSPEMLNQWFTEPPNTVGDEEGRKAKTSTLMEKIEKYESKFGSSTDKKKDA